MYLSKALHHAFPLVSRSTDSSSSLPSPISFPPSRLFDGNDGRWSSFALQAGHPAQQLRVMPSTDSAALWLNWEQEACPDFLPLPPGTGDCVESRGGVYNANESTTWVANSIFSNGVDPNLGFDDDQMYGFDNVAIGFNNDITIQHQTLALNADPHYWLGGFPLNPRPFNFTTANNPQNSTFQQLRENNRIPSVSYGYAAGAYYRNQTLGSLTLGGYDSSIWTPDGNSIPMYAGSTHTLVVGLRSVTSNATSASLLPGGPILSVVDSTFPFIWLPKDACAVFEKTFNISYDESTQLYLLNASTHAALVKQNPSVTFEIGSGLSEGFTRNITLPFAAFDLNVSFNWIPQNQSSTWYFPLKRAANNTQYTLGRTLLQESYLAVDFEHQNFTLQQRDFSNTGISTTGNIAPFYPAGYSPPKSGLSGGAIAGIVIGALAGVVLLGGLAGFYFWRQRKHRRDRDAALFAAMEKNDQADSNSDRPSAGGTVSTEQGRGMAKTADPAADGITATGVHEIGAPREIYEASAEAGKAPHGELQGSQPGAWEADGNMRFELPGGEVPLGMSEKLGGAKLVGWDGLTESQRGSPTRVTPAGEGEVQWPSRPSRSP